MMLLHMALENPIMDEVATAAPTMQNGAAGA
jgi:hypothetical protein